MHDIILNNFFGTEEWECRLAKPQASILEIKQMSSTPWLWYMYCIFVFIEFQIASVKNTKQSQRKKKQLHFWLT